MRPNRIKEARFNSFDVAGSTLPNTFPNVPTNGMNGEIIRIVLTNITSPGSLWIAESGTDIELWRRNNITSGLVAFDVYPFVYNVNSVNVTGSPEVFTNRVVAGPIYIAASGLTSGTNKTFGPITVQYR